MANLIIKNNSGEQSSITADRFIGSADKLNISDTGSAIQPVYFKDGVPVAGEAITAMTDAEIDAICGELTSQILDDISVDLGGI